MKKSLFTLSLLSLFISPLYAEEHEDSVVGVTYELNEQGEFKNIRSTAEADLEFGDRKDIRTATQKAQLRAKANIAKFLNERITSDEVVENITNTITHTTGQSKEAVRDTVETHTETIKNSAEAWLKGAIVLKTDVNKDEKYVQVEMGISEKTMKAADGLNGALQTDSSTPASSLPNSGNVTQQIEQGSGREIRKAKNYDNF